MTMKFNRKTFFLLYLSVSICSISAQEMDGSKHSGLTLTEMIQLALKGNKRVLQVKESMIAAEAKIGESRSLYFPQLRLESNYHRLNTFSTFKLELPGMPTEEIKLGTPNNYSTQVSLSQSLFNWGRNRKAVELSEIELTLAEHNASLTEREVSYTVVQLFYRILTLEAALKVMDGSIELLEQRLSTMQKKYEAGETSNFGLLSTEVQISSAKSQKLDTQTDLKRTKLELNRIIGRDAEADVELQDSLASHSITLDEKALLREAMGNRVEVKQSEHREKQVLLQKEIVSTTNKPSVDFYLNWNIKNGYLPNVDVFIGDWNTGLVFSLPLFDGFRASAQEVQAGVNLRITQIAHDEMSQSIETEVKQAIVSLNASQEKTEIEKLKINQAEQALKIAEAQYENGQISSLDLLDSQRSLQAAKLNYLQAVYSFSVNKYSLTKVVGRGISPESLKY